MSAKKSPGKSPGGKSPGAGVKGIGKSKKVAKARGKKKDMGPKSMEELDAELTSYTSARNAEPATAPMGDAGAVPVA